MTHLPPTTRLSPTTRLLLVHSPLVGPASWDLIAPALTEPGRDVTIPELSSTIAAGPPWCSRQAELIARAAAGQPAVLVGHSRAGPILAAAGALIPQVRGYVFVDARLPFPGQTWMDTTPPELVTRLREMAGPDGWLPPWPNWWGAEALAEILPDPVIRERFTAGCPPPLANLTASVGVSRVTGTLAAAECNKAPFMYEMKGALSGYGPGSAGFPASRLRVSQSPGLTVPDRLISQPHRPKIDRSPGLTVPVRPVARTPRRHAPPAGARHPLQIPVSRPLHRPGGTPGWCPFPAVKTFLRPSPASRKSPLQFIF
jgi:hypothetical protein